MRLPLKLTTFPPLCLIHFINKAKASFLTTFERNPKLSDHLDYIIFVFKLNSCLILFILLCTKRVAVSLITWSLTGIDSSHINKTYVGELGHHILPFDPLFDPQFLYFLSPPSKVHKLILVSFSLSKFWSGPPNCALLTDFVVFTSP